MVGLGLLKDIFGFRERREREKREREERERERERERDDETCQSYLMVQGFVSKLLPQVRSRLRRGTFGVCLNVPFPSRMARVWLGFRIKGCVISVSTSCMHRT